MYERFNPFNENYLKKKKGFLKISYLIFHLRKITDFAPVVCLGFDQLLIQTLNAEMKIVRYRQSLS